MRRVLALGQFDFSRHTLVAMADRGVEVHYGYVGTPQFLPEASERLTVFPVPKEDRPEHLAAAVRRVRPDVVLVGTASYDGSNRVAAELLDADLGVPLVRFYKEFVLKPSALERTVLRGVDGLVAGGEREGLYFRAVYGLDADRVHAFDPDVISSHMIVSDPLPKLSDLDGAPHVVLGGNLKADDSEFDYRDLLRGLADAGVHVHVYALGFSRWLARGRALDPNSEEVRTAYDEIFAHDHVHLEKPVFGAEQMTTWTQFDAGLTQREPGVFWPELTPVQNMNLPSKYSYYLGAGLPIAVQRSTLPALRELLAGTGMLVEFDTVDELAARLHDRAGMARTAATVRRRASDHTAQAGIDDVLAFIDGIIGRR